MLSSLVPGSEIVMRLLRVKSLRVSKAEEEKMKEMTCKKCDCKQSLYDRYVKAKQELESQEEPGPSQALHEAYSRSTSGGSLSSWRVSESAEGKTRSTLVWRLNWNVNCIKERWQSPLLLAVQG